MSAPMTLYLIRHGEVYNPDGILYGRLPGFSLSDVGRGQSSAAGRVLADKPIKAIYASPMQRAQETAHIIQNSIPEYPRVQVDERLNEVHTPYDGTPHAELDKTHFDLYSGTQPPYEQPVDIIRRVLDWLAQARKKHAHQSVVAISHGDVVVAMFLWAKRYRGNDMARLQLESLGLPEAYPATASLSRFIFRTDDPDEIPDYSYQKPY